MVWPQNPTLPRLRRPAAPESPQEGRGPAGSPRPAPGRPAPRSRESGRGKLNRKNIISRKSGPKLYKCARRVKQSGPVLRMFGRLPRWPKIFRGRIADLLRNRADRGWIEGAAELLGLGAA